MSIAASGADVTAMSNWNTILLHLFCYQADVFQIPHLTAILFRYVPLYERHSITFIVISHKKWLTTFTIYLCCQTFIFLTAF